MLFSYGSCFKTFMINLKQLMDSSRVLERTFAVFCDFGKPCASAYATYQP